MKILELGKFYPPERGGIETLLKLWCEGFVAAGDEVDCVVANTSARTVDETPGGVRVHRLASHGMAMGTSLCPSYISAPRRFPADIVHAHFPNPLADLACLRTPKGTPVVVSWHSDIVRQRALMGLYKPLQTALLRRADRIVVATPNHLEFSPWLPAFRDKVAVIPFGLDLARFAPGAFDPAKVAALRARAGGRAILLNVGRLVGYKGQRHAIEALAELPGAELWLVGTGPLEAALRGTAAAAGVADRVVFHGDVADADLPCFFHACDIFVFPSVTPNEAFGLVQVEAMACGKPVVACTLRSGVPWVCADGVTGLTVPPGESAALALALRRLLGEESLRLRLGEAGRRRAREEFASAVMVERYRSLFARLRGPTRLE